MWSYFKLIAWGVAWFVAWAVTFPWRRGRENCLTWAVNKWDKEGGYLVIRWCRHNKFPFVKWPHFLWLEEKHHNHLEHVIPKEGIGEYHILPNPWFEPEHKKGDSHKIKEN